MAEDFLIRNPQQYVTVCMVITVAINGGFEDRNKPSLFHPTIFLVSFLLEVTQNTIEKRTTFGLDSWNFLGKDSLVLLKPLFVYRVKDPGWEPLPVTQPELHRAALGE